MYFLFVFCGLWSSSLLVCLVMSLTFFNRYLLFQFLSVCQSSLSVCVSQLSFASLRVVVLT